MIENQFLETLRTTKVIAKKKLVKSLSLPFCKFLAFFYNKFGSFSQYGFYWLSVISGGLFDMLHVEALIPQWVSNFQTFKPVQEGI